MNWDSFVPDLLVGGATGLVVGFVVLGYEKRDAKRTRSGAVTEAQARVVERARSLLQHPLVFSHKGDPSLHVDSSQLERLQGIVRSVPAGVPDEHIPGYHWASRAIDSFESLESLADALDARLADYQSDGGPVLRLGDFLGSNITRLSKSWPVPHDWTFVLPDGLPETFRAKIEDDVELRGNVDQYLRTRRLLEAHRRAFVGTDGRWRELEWSALAAKDRGAPRFFVTKWLRALEYRHAVRRAMNEAEDYGYGFISEVDGMAY
ncbi:hypothetical protein [Microbacterium foliorum]|uniref:hypothetical protein n=1 Tax=Microbacterium foliorum TaxID=104336 RepID=UPI00099FAD04|nr:hypothetical protein [Microbacterium foliorum]AQY02049.1 hypothetical protein B2G67_11630 [Microbacterium foliorum]